MSTAQRLHSETLQRVLDGADAILALDAEQQRIVAFVARRMSREMEILLRQSKGELLKQGQRETPRMATVIEQMVEIWPSSKLVAIYDGTFTRRCGDAVVVTVRI